MYILYMTKICNKCKIKKDLNEFHTNNHLKDKKSYTCKECTKIKTENRKEYNRASYNKWKNNNREKWRAAQKLRRQNNSLKYCKRRELFAKLASSSERYNKVIGCSPVQLKKYIESLFKENMNWNNKGEVWQLDHILPYCAFSKEESRYINHYLNLQPIYKEENLLKGKFWKEEDKQVLMKKVDELDSSEIDKFGDNITKYK